MENNEGIINNGGSISARNMIAGANSTINETVQNQSPDLRQAALLLNNLLESLKTTTQDVPNKAEVISAVETLQTEVKKEKPGHLTLKSVGKGVLDSLKYVTELAPIAEQVWHHLSAFITH